MIRIIVTGGTFDKTYDEINGRLSFGATHLPEMLRLGRSRVEVTVRTLMMIDSLEMTDADRALIVEHCRRSGAFAHCSTMILRSASVMSRLSIIISVRISSSRLQRPSFSISGR